MRIKESLQDSLKLKLAILENEELLATIQEVADVCVDTLCSGG